MMRKMTVSKKFELTTETKIIFGRTLYRIRALSAFDGVEAGEAANGRRGGVTQ